MLNLLLKHIEAYIGKSSKLIIKVIISTYDFENAFIVYEFYAHAWEKIRADCIVIINHHKNLKILNKEDIDPSTQIDRIMHNGLFFGFYKHRFMTALI